ncbi:MAG TPA: cysteine dioxygenase family protein [Polyangiaceae bacterium]|nr:cysteine dioxygenase family protein [Polyangiaceae bacterium]
MNPTWGDALACVTRRDAAALARLAMGWAGEGRAARPMPRVGQPYGRRVLFTSPEGEVMLASWRRGARCAPHDHGEARGLVLVLDGVFTEGVYEATADGGIRAGSSRVVAAGDTLAVGHGLVHDMRAHGGGATLHVYVPGVHAMRVYDRDARATLLVAGGCGAWVPDEPSHVLRRWDWESAAP